MTLDIKSSNTDKRNAKKMLDLILDDEFLFHLHMHHDLHESVLGKFVYSSDKSIARVLNFVDFPFENFRTSNKMDAT
jgi:hypothetical protein